MQHARFRGDHEAARGRDPGAPHHLLGRHDLRAASGDVTFGLGVVHRARHAAALRMHQKLCVGILDAALLQHLAREPGVHVTLTHPDVELPAGDFAQVIAEKHVREKEDGDVGRERADDRDRVPRSAAVVRLGLHVGRGIHVGDHDAVRMRRAPGAHVGRLNRGGQRTARGAVGNEDALVGVRDRRGFRHEMHTANHQDRGIELRGATGHLQRVGHDVGEVLDFRTLIVVCEDRGTASDAKFIDLREEVTGR